MGPSSGLAASTPPLLQPLGFLCPLTPSPPSYLLLLLQVSTHPVMELCICFASPEPPSPLLLLLLLLQSLCICLRPLSPPPLSSSSCCCYCSHCASAPRLWCTLAFCCSG